VKILITGAGGFLGKRIVQRLLAHGQTDLRCMVRDVTKADGLRELAAQHPEAQLEIVSVNLRNASEIPAAVAGCELVVHAAAALKGSPAEMFMDSCVASRNLLDAVATRKPMRVVHISSFGAVGVNSQSRGALLDERIPMEQHPERRDLYSYTKLRQEQLFWDYQRRFGIELVVLRPGVIYGPGGGRFSNRVGLELFGRFLHLGGSNLLPLTYVDNCAEAIAVAALSPQASGQVFHVVDDDLPTSSQYLSQFSREVQPMRAVPVPFFVLMAISRQVERYNLRSKGQLPAIFTPYKTLAMWGGNRFTNAKLKSLGWSQVVPTREGIARSFAWFRANPVPKK
jgi:nucleoside-diphosphate-sugar epimerase